MVFAEASCTEFAARLASRDAVPGGGGASALVGALGAALASMVGNLTTGKKKYAAYEEDIQFILKRAAELQEELIGLIDRDAECFEPLSKAYSIPKDDPDRDTVMENALRVACSVPMDIIRMCARVIELHVELAEKGSTLAVSDVGCGAVFCKAALQGAALSVFINTKSMKDREYAAQIETEADAILAKSTAMADGIYDTVAKKLRG